MIIIIMGVSGCGKTTIGKLLSKKTGINFYDADDFHPSENIEKMKNNMPLTDVDRTPWLLTLSKKLKEWDQTTGAILACSALKESYRELLNSEIENPLWIYLSGSFEQIKERLESRDNHYMPSSLLKSQFETLEIPTYGLHIPIEQTPTTITNTIISNTKRMNKATIGIIGLGVMGKSLSLNIAEKGFPIAVYNRKEKGEENIVSEFLQENKSFENLVGFSNIQDFINSVEKPRQFFLMIKAGKAIDAVIEQIIPYLSKNDIIIDGGNSHYLDTEKRYNYLATKQINFIGCGVSGGEEGARKGPSIMPGGNPESYKIVAPILEAISAKDSQNNPCCTFIGNKGAGHFIKMVHNGIEYAEMQLLAELYGLLSSTMNNIEIANLFSTWNKTDLASYLLEITIEILRKKEGDNYLLESILDKAGNKGTGSWSSKAALDLGVPNTMMASAVFARYMSSFKEKRIALSKKLTIKKSAPQELNIAAIENAYRFARIVNHHQGFDLMQEASTTYYWDLNLSEIARIWTNGCIIRSNFMGNLVVLFKQNESILDHATLFDDLNNSEDELKKLIEMGLTNRVPLDTFWASYNYWISMTSENLPANLIQAQRDYFGAHTYQRKNDTSNQFFHTNWLKND
ncbi:NADP-dependent phosphogluconate dehydrogenase [Formosa sp. PL04]|uniref:NADP-dependent phosphogluconate dehydrogenase n=1 Tax=Formosa sp. PL04 TaxID=3081755 RepID=UPI002980FBCB|nr:NADP-dependent phosphogluconate dehydrogenase [Formosa sp. PL04]MDW5288032.1 NADP-dependent phosphogluconate dehydrogenase [Formosa sp. PL04]